MKITRETITDEPINLKEFVEKYLSHGHIPALTTYKERYAYGFDLHICEKEGLKNFFQKAVGIFGFSGSKIATIGYWSINVFAHWWVSDIEKIVRAYEEYDPKSNVEIILKEYGDYQPPEKIKENENEIL